MPFRGILDEVVNKVSGARGALFIDAHGDSVGHAGMIDDHDLQVIGAYQGIHRRQIDEICRDTGHGDPRRIKIAWRGSMILNASVADGYSVILILDEGASEALAWREIERARRRLMAEM